MPIYVTTSGGARHCVCEGHVTDAIARPGDDGLQADGHAFAAVEIEDHVFDFRCIPEKTQDEVVSGIRGANVTMRRCMILGGIKAILAGNGDHPIADFANARWHLEDCAIAYSGRRCPEAQDGTHVTMKRCWIHDWGYTFDVRAFGAWAHRGGVILAEDCIFTQSRGLLANLFAMGPIRAAMDLGNHLGQMANQYGWPGVLRARAWVPGVARGLTCDTGGLTLATRYWKNRWWIRIDNGENKMTRQSARNLARNIVAQLETTAEVKLHAAMFYSIMEHI